MITRFIGCLHFGHKNMAIHRGFQDEFYHDEHLIDSWNSVVKNKKDITYILGDVTMEKSFWYYQLDRLNGIKHVILGNHDRRQDVPKLLEHVTTVGGMIDYKGFALTHCPIHPNEAVFYRGNIHAHIHHVNKLEEVTVSSSYTDMDAIPAATQRRYYNVDAKLINFKPKTIEELLKM
jgi:calcineurin-like phosphoesterase family protein